MMDASVIHVGDELYRLLSSKEVLHLNIDVVSYADLVRNRAKRIRRITGTRTSEVEIVQSCKEYFYDHLTNSCPYDEYLWCLMNARLLGIPMEFTLVVNHVVSVNRDEIRDEWNRLNNQVDKQNYTSGYERSSDELTDYRDNYLYCEWQE